MTNASLTAHTVPERVVNCPSRPMLPITTFARQGHQLVSGVYCDVSQILKYTKGKRTKGLMSRNSGVFGHDGNTFANAA